MGLREWFVRREADGFEKEHKMQWQAVKDWLNAKPGRKRGIGAALAGVGAALAYLGHPQGAEAAQLVDKVVQGIEAGTTISGILFTVWGWLHAHSEGRA